MKTLSIHQPNFIPWTGFFNKLILSDVFIILDSVQYPRGKSVANRNLIKIGKDPIQLVVPITIPKGNNGMVAYNEVKFGDEKWVGKILKSLEMGYAKSPFYDTYMPNFENIFSNKNFSQMNIEFINFVTNHLNIKTELFLLSSIESDLGSKNDLIINLCKKFSANQYLSGKGAAKYNDESYLNSSNIKLIYQNYTAKVYPQLKGEFIPNLSIIDLLFNCGKESIAYLK